LSWPNSPLSTTHLQSAGISFAYDTNEQKEHHSKSKCHPQTGDERRKYCPLPIEHVPLNLSIFSNVGNSCSETSVSFATWLASYKYGHYDLGSDCIKIHWF
jgi:hypothetical protein